MLGRLLQVRRGELTRTTLLFAYLFLIITSYVVTKATRDALFLERYSAARLPYADIASALSVGAVMAVYLRVSRLVGLRLLLVGTLVLFSAMSLLFWALARGVEPSWMLPVLYIWASVFGVLLPTQVWTLANYVVTTREAKRLFGLISSGAICGWIVGGMLTRATAMRLGSESLLLMTSATLALCPLLVLGIWRERHVEREGEAPRHEVGGLHDSLQLIRGSAHLRAIAILVALSSLVTTIVAWQFRAVAKASIPDTDALTAFFGSFNIYAGALSLVTQLFITSRLLRRFGLGTALLVVPVALTAGSLGVLMWGGLATAVLLRGSDHVLRYSIDRSTTEMLYLPVPERQIVRAKAFIDTVILRIGDSAGALLVLLGVSVIGLTASQMSAVSIMLLMAWVAAAVTARRQYVESLQNSIYEHRVDAERLAAQPHERSTTEVLVDTFGADNPHDVLYALTLYADREAPMARLAIRRLLDHQSAPVRKKAISVLAAAADTTVLSQIEALIEDGDPGVRAEALLYLARFSDVDPLMRLQELDGFESAAIAPAIAHFLARSGPGQNLDAVRALLDAAIASPGAAGAPARLEAARLIASLPDRFDEPLNRLLKDPDPEVARAAIRAAASLGKTAVVPLLVERIWEADLCADLADALVTFGEHAVPPLQTALADLSGSSQARRAIPDILQRIGTPDAEHTLVEYLLDGDAVLRLGVIAALNKLRQHNPNRRMERELIETVLSAEIFGHYRSYQMLGKLWAEGASEGPDVQQVKESMGRELERIFRLMKLLFPDHDLHSAYVGLRSKNRIVHANALEFLEHSLPPAMRALLLPLIDDEVSAEERIGIADRLVGAARETPEQALAAFTETDELLREAARHAEKQLGPRTPV